MLLLWPGQRAVAALRAVPSRSVPPRRALPACHWQPLSMSAVAPAAAAVPTLDERLVADQPELVKQTLTMRRASQEQLDVIINTRDGGASS